MLFDDQSNVNINYFNLFEFGRLNGGYSSVLFTSKKKNKTKSWGISIDLNSVTINSVTEDGKEPQYTNNSFSFPVKFYKQDSFKFILQKRSDTLFNTEDGNSLKDNTFRILLLNQDKYRILFHFDLPFDDDSQYRWLFFENKRVNTKPLL
jgi:hypothetical protein